MDARTALDIRLLGPLEVRVTGAVADRPFPLGGPRQRTLFGLLALRAPHVVSQHQLIDGIWDEAPPPAATKTLHAHVAHLRRTLAAAGIDRSIETRPPGYALAAEPEQVDARRFESLVRRGRAALGAGAATEAADCLTAALRLWRGDVLADCPLGEWARAEVAALREASRYATEDLQAARLVLGEYAAATADLEALVGQEPLRERLWELLIVALYRCGRQGDALAAYRRARTVLAEELGVAPGSALRELEAAILAGDDHLDAVTGLAVPPRATAALLPAEAPGAEGALPAPLTSLVGRGTEIAELTGLLAERRLVTLTGVGGCGKTRLAIAVAASSAIGPVRFVDLSAVTAADSVPRLVAAAYGLRDRPDTGAADQLVRHLRTAQTLLVLDNCEHLVEPCAELAGTLLSRCPELRVLATSREPFGVPGEVGWPVPALAVPADGDAGLDAVRRYDSVRLFLDRVAVPAARSLTDADAPALAAICARLDGLPLAIELAAARTSVLTVPEIAARLGDPTLLRAPAGGRQRPQHAALDATMAWSYQLLDPALRSFFRRLAVFTGGFILDAAQAVWSTTPGQALDALHELVVKSLVVMERRRSSARYRLLATIRQYAAERLAAEPDECRTARDAHATYYREMAEDVGQRLRGPHLDTLLDRLAADEENVLSALGWYAEHGPAETELRLANALAHYFHLRGRYGDGRRWLERALSRADRAAPAERARGWVSAAHLAQFSCDYPGAAQLGGRALATYRDLADLPGMARSTSLLASVDRERGRYDAAIERSLAAAELYRRAGDDWGVGDARQMTGFAAWLAGDLKPAEEWLTEALDRFQALGDVESIASARIHLAVVAHYNGEPARARWLAEEALARCTEAGFKEGIAWSWNVLGLVEHRDGRVPPAIEALRESLLIHHEVGDRWRSASVLETLAAVMVPGSTGTAVDLLAGAATIRESIGAPVPPQERAAFVATIALARATLGDSAYLAARARGASLGVADLIALLPAAVRSS